jgi:hypothetical protein
MREVSCGKARRWYFRGRPRHAPFHAPPQADHRDEPTPALSVLACVDCGSPGTGFCQLAENKLAEDKLTEDKLAEDKLGAARPETCR